MSFLKRESFIALQITLKEEGRGAVESQRK